MTWSTSQGTLFDIVHQDLEKMYIMYVKLQNFKVWLLIHTYIHTYTNRHKHTNTHTHTHTHTTLFVCVLQAVPGWNMIVLNQVIVFLWKHAAGCGAMIIKNIFGGVSNSWQNEVGLAWHSGFVSRNLWCLTLDYGSGDVKINFRSDINIYSITDLFNAKYQLLK